MFSLRRLFEADSPRDRIFISYRRSDTEGYAGRLGDTLKGYFGDHRIFRDVGGISAGEDFQQKIERSIEGAGALIVLIGPGWLVTNDDGIPRLHEPRDFVAGEIKAALEKNRLVLPVLVKGAKMPLEEDLPEDLRAVTRRNATTINDESWLSDVTRLAKVISFDLAGSLAERRLGWMKYCVLSILLVSMIFTLVRFAQAAFSTTCLASVQHTDLYPVLTPDKGGSTSSGVKRSLLELTKCEEGGKPVAFTKSAASVNPFAIFVAILTLLATKSWIDPSRRKFIWAAVGFAGLSTSLTYLFYLATSDIYPVGARVGAFAATSIIIAGMLVLMGLSGFKPNERVS